MRVHTVQRHSITFFFKSTCSTSKKVDSAFHADEVEFEKGEFKQLLVEAVAKMRPKLESPDH